MASIGEGPSRSFSVIPEDVMLVDEEDLPPPPPPRSTSMAHAPPVVTSTPVPTHNAPTRPIAPLPSSCDQFPKAYPVSVWAEGMAKYKALRKSGDTRPELVIKDEIFNDYEFKKNTWYKYKSLFLLDATPALQEKYVKLGEN
ncbi:hypothetical protein MPER_14699, partial [Moniliophthora perniciosa FA553]